MALLVAMNRTRERRKRFEIELKINQDVTCRSMSITESVVDKSIIVDVCRLLSIDEFNLSIISPRCHKYTLLRLISLSLAKFAGFVSRGRGGGPGVYTPCFSLRLWLLYQSATDA